MRAQPRPRRDLDLLEVQLAGALGLGGHLLVPREPGLGLGLPGLGPGAHPGQFLPQSLGQLDVLAALHRHPLGLLLQVGGVVALVRDQPAAVDLGDPLRHVVQEVPVVGDGQHGAGVVGQELLEPEHRFGVQVVGRLVEQQQVGRGEQQLAQGDPPLLAAGEHRDVGVRGWAAQRVHGLLELRVEVPGVGVVDVLLQLAHLLDELVAVVGRQQVTDLVVPRDLGVGLAEAPPARSPGRSCSRPAPAPA